MGSRLFKDPVVREELSRLKAELSPSPDMADADSREDVAGLNEILMRLTRIMRREEPEDNMVRVKEKTRDAPEGKKGAEYNETINIIQTRTKTSDALRAADLLLKYHYRDEDNAKADRDAPAGIVILPEVKANNNAEIIDNWELTIDNYVHGEAS